MEKDNIKKDIDEMPLVSIWCPTYNNIEYIKDTLEGFLSQKTTFAYEIVIHDDASTDGTVEILREYEKAYPNKIKVIYQKKNIYQQKDRRDILNNIMQTELRGKYVALCEGDDYWIKPDKLQKQIDYLEAHEDCVLVVHNNWRENCETGEIEPQNKTSKNGPVSARSVILFEEPTFQTATYVMNKEIVILEDFYKECGVGDYPMKLKALTQGYIYYFDEVMSVYRYKGESSWTSKYHDNGAYQFVHFVQMIVFLQKYDKDTNGQYGEWVRKRIRDLAYYLFFMLYNRREEIKDVLETVVQNTDPQYHPYVYKIVELFENGTKIENQMEALLKYCRGNDEIWLWGTGVVSERYTRALEEVGIEIKGYIVTEKDGTDVFHGKKVWEIRDLPYDEKKMGIIVATMAWSSYQISQVMEEYNIMNYYSNYETTLWNVE